MGCAASVKTSNKDPDGVTAFDDGRDGAANDDDKETMRLRRRTVGWNDETEFQKLVERRKSMVNISPIMGRGEISWAYFFSDTTLSRRPRVTIRLVTCRKGDDVGALRACKQHSLQKVPGVSAEQDPELIKKQALMLSWCAGHPNIIDLHEVYLSSATKIFYELLEFCSGGRLFDGIVEADRHTERETANFVQQLLSAVSHMHALRVCHRDIKPEHILLKDTEMLIDCQIKLIDFSTACEIKNEPMTEKVGTPYYVSPQVHEARYTEACDVWSCGVVMYLLLLGYPRRRRQLIKHPSMNGRELMLYLIKGKFAAEKGLQSLLSSGANALLDELLAPTEESRPTAEDAARSMWLKHQAPQPPGIGIVQTGVPYSSYLPGECQDRAGVLF
eukprot:gb/GFBE01018325.1/.p1 GENE.gb/GFBE01018325.1/~~gb/GFBE01018325.1/.p1  ORF type:complete len:388 (+),score=50.37 gb/GFBE01018325.1/:1-1164(+)